LTLRIFVPFVAVYYLAFLFRNINATIAGSLTSDLGLTAGNLGLLTSVYYLAFAAAQIPIGILVDRCGPGRVQSVVLVAAALGAALFAVSNHYWLLLCGRALIGVGVAAAMTAGMKALVVWFPREHVPLLSGLMVTLGAMGALSATSPADLLIGSVGWRGLFGLLAMASVGCSLVIYLFVPDPPVVEAVGEPVATGLRAIYAEPRFWRLAPLSAACVGTAWALQGLWVAPWLTDVAGLDRTGSLRYLFVMAIALGMGALLLGATAGRLLISRVGPSPLLGLVAVLFILAQLTLILRLPVPSYLPWSVIAAVGAMTVLSYTILSEYFPKEFVGRANAALNVLHIGVAFILQYLTGMVLQLWPPLDGHYPEVAYQAAFALNVFLQIAAGIWFALPWLFKACGRIG
jgi:MFS family permease